MSILSLCLPKLQQARIILFDFQKKTVEFALERQIKNVGALLVLPCGYGKTIVAICLIVADTSKKTLWIVPSTLEEQTYAALKTFLYPESNQQDSESLQQQQQVLANLVWLRKSAHASELERADVVLVSHTKLKKFEQSLESADFKRVIVGE